MKKYAMFAVLLAASAVGQSYKFTAPPVPTQQDVTTMTTTVNAWVYKTGSCKLGSLVGTLGTQWCLGPSDNAAYKFDISKKQWIKQPQFGTSLISVAAAGSSNVYSLQTVGHCGAGYYGLFRWIGSWSEDANLPCLSHVSAAADGSMLAGIGFNSNTGHPALFYSSSNPGGTWPNVSWTLQTDSLISVEMGNGSVGCSVDANGGMWEIHSSAAPQQLPALPSGANRAVGCLYAMDPDTAMAWTTTTGSVYTMPFENWGTWQQVTGISAVGITGLSRSSIFAQDFSGKPYHWNVFAPGIASTYGGQWTPAQGCPIPRTPCNNPTTHTLHHSLYFTSCHGINGCQDKTTTGLWSANLAVPNSDNNPQCDPYLGGGVDDPECHVTESANGHCNASGATLDPTGTLNWIVGDSIDVLDYTYNVGQSGPMRVQTGPYAGYYSGTITNQVTDGCAISDPVPVCPQGSPVEIFNEVKWWGSLQAEGIAYADWHVEQGEHVSGESSPYVSHSFYIAQVDDNGIFISRQCFGGYIGKNDFLYGDIAVAPACK